MRNYSNQNSSSGRPSSGGRPSNGNRGGYQGRSGGSSGSGGYNRENREGRDNRGGGYRGGNRYEKSDRGENRGGHHQGSGFHRSSSQHTSSSHRNDRHERPERSEGYTPRIGSSWVEVTGRSVEEAVEEAARRFNVNKNDFKTEVLEEGNKGFLGIGSKPAKVKVSLKSSSIPSFAEGVLSRLLRGMSLPDKVKIQKDSDGNTVLNIQGPSSGTLIGRHGHTLEALQYLVSKVAQRMTGDEKSIIIVDVENYLERQKDKLKELALNLAQKAKETGVEIPMRPMSSKDRRVVHLSLKDHEHVTTESRGEGLRRKVVIVPKVKAENVTPEAAAAAASAGDVEPENVAPPEEDQPVVENQPLASTAVAAEPPSDQPIEPGNVVPKEPEIDDSIGNRA
jgi:spoIIIJ-associated protein